MSTARTLPLSIALSVLLAAPVLPAQEEAAPAPVAAPAADADLPAAKEAKKAKKKKKKGTLEPTGRVFIRETIADSVAGDWGAQTSIASARLGLRYHWKELRARVAVEFRKTAKLRSTYLELGPAADLTARAGLFKIPLSPLELTSSWVLPVADRGLISNILTNRLQVAGRRVGAMLVWAPGASADKAEPWSFKARGGYFQGVNDVGDLLDAVAADAFGKVGAVRLELGPFGASGQVRTGQPELLGPIRTAWAAAADAKIEVAGLRLWLEGTLGSSWLVAVPTRQEAIFFEGRGVAAWRLGGAKTGEVYLEPYAMFGVVDPDRQLADDLVLEASGGVNVGMWKRWRFQAELEVWRFGKNVPFGFVDPGVAPVDRTAVVAQLGAAF